MVNELFIIIYTPSSRTGKAVASNAERFWFYPGSGFTD